MYNRSFISILCFCRRKQFRAKSKTTRQKIALCSTPGGNRHSFSVSYVIPFALIGTLRRLHDALDYSLQLINSYGLVKSSAAHIIG